MATIKICDDCGGRLDSPIVVNEHGELHPGCAERLEAIEAGHTCNKCRFNRQGGRNSWSERCNFCGPGRKNFEPIQAET